MKNLSFKLLVSVFTMIVSSMAFAAPNKNAQANCSLDLRASKVVTQFAVKNYDVDKNEGSTFVFILKNASGMRVEVNPANEGALLPRNEIFRFFRVFFDAKSSMVHTMLFDMDHMTELGALPTGTFSGVLPVEVSTPEFTLRCQVK